MGIHLFMGVNGSIWENNRYFEIGVKFILLTSWWFKYSDNSTVITTESIH